MKLLNEIIDVTLSDTKAENKNPQTLQRGSFTYRVRAIDEEWEYEGRWWTDAPALMGIHRDYYRVTCTTNYRTFVTMEIYQQAGEWYIARVLD